MGDQLKLDDGTDMRKFANFLNVRLQNSVAGDDRDFFRRYFGLFWALFEMGGESDQ
ncbi:MAG: hypothetical protein SLRJCFUN_002457 [Candidatus Fervidibacter sp.]